MAQMSCHLGIFRLRSGTFFTLDLRLVSTGAFFNAAVFYVPGMGQS